MVEKLTKKLCICFWYHWIKIFVIFNLQRHLEVVWNSCESHLKIKLRKVDLKIWKNSYISFLGHWVGCILSHRIQGHLKVKLRKQIVSFGFAQFEPVVILTLKDTLEVTFDSYSAYIRWNWKMMIGKGPRTFLMENRSWPGGKTCSHVSIPWR